MEVLYTAFTAKKKGKSYSISQKTMEITEYCSSIVWSGSKSEVARKVELTLINAPNDPHVKDVILKLGSMIYLYDDKKKELFRGYIVERERKSSETVRYTVYDLLFYLLKSKATYNFKKKTPEAITAAVCKDVKVATGKIAKTGKKYNLMMKDRSIYQIIMAAYTKANKSTGNKYQCYTSGGKVCVRKYGDDWFDTILSAKANIISSTNRESISDVVNQVKIYNEKGSQIKVVKDEKSIVNYGLFQHTYTKEKDKDPTNSAKAMFRDVSRSMDVEMVGYTGCVTGKCVQLKDDATGLVGKFYIESDSHTWQGGIHTMKLTLSLKNDMDKQGEDS